MAELHRKYDVRKVNDPRHKHAMCEFFVLDLNHDPHARTAVLAYARAVQDENPSFAAELFLAYGERIG